jgi:hypothetical protein
MQRAVYGVTESGKEQRAKSRGQRLNAQTFQQGGFIPLSTRPKIIAVFITFVLTLTACCAPATNSSTPLPETAFTATFLGLSNDGQTLLAKPEQSSNNVQLIYDKALTLPIGQRVYIVGRLEGNLVYVTDLRIL